MAIIYLVNNYNCHYEIYDYLYKNSNLVKSFS